MIIVGERINGTSRKIREAVMAREAAFIADLARRQVEAGADYLDVNAGTDPEREPEDMVWLVQTVQAATNQPCCIDSPNPEALRAGLEAHEGQALVNSASAETARMEATIRLAAEHKARLVGLTLDDTGLPATAEARIAIAARLVEAAQAAGMAITDLFIDPLARAVAVENEQGAALLDAIEGIMCAFPGIHTICGLSNISFQMPMRPLLNRTFLALAMARGMDAAIMDPLDRSLMATACAGEVLLGRDEMCLEFIQAFRAGKLEE